MCVSASDPRAKKRPSVVDGSRDQQKFDLVLSLQVIEKLGTILYLADTISLSLIRNGTIFAFASKSVTPPRSLIRFTVNSSGAGMSVLPFTNTIFG